MSPMIKLYFILEKTSREGVIPNDFTFSMILSAHPLVSPFQVHAKLIKTNHKDSASAVSLSDDIFIDNKIKYVQL
ncbi:hypothetical protein V2J09_002831 [Rumex salicifolius]